MIGEPAEDAAGFLIYKEDTIRGELRMKRRLRVLSKVMAGVLCLQTILAGSAAASEQVYVGDSVDAGASAEYIDVDPLSLEWTGRAFGNSANPNKNIVVNNTTDGKMSVTLYSVENAGKLISKTTADGINTYFTKVSTDKNFSFSATAHVLDWSRDNNHQEAFGLMVLDRVPDSNTTKKYYNNAYYAGMMKNEYYYEAGSITNSSNADCIQMNNGIAVLSKTGIDADEMTQLDAAVLDTNISDIDVAIAAKYKVKTTTLETICAEQGAGTYNLFGNSVGVHKLNGTTVSVNYVDTIEAPITDIRLNITKNNTGYFFTYEGEHGRTVKFYDPNALSQADKDNVYLGFFTARNATATFDDVELKMIDAELDAAPESRDYKKYELDGGFISSPMANMSKYDLRFQVNWDGDVVIKQEDKEIYNGSVLADNTIVVSDLELNVGGNTFTADFTPDREYHPEDDEANILSDEIPEQVSISYIVNHVEYSEEGQYLYVTPEGKKDGVGTKESPLDIATALKYVQKGQAILLKSGKYELADTLTIEDGVDGAADKPIYMITEGDEPAVFDFSKAKGENGLIVMGDYWYIENLEVMGADKFGINVMGENDVIDQCIAHDCGKDGIIITSDQKRQNAGKWPRNNMVLNCTAYNNNDVGIKAYHVKEGTVIDGCIAYNNAEGIALAPSRGGVTGTEVTLKNSIAYFNGFVPTAGGGFENLDGVAGNGIRAGGDNYSTSHKVLNCFSFYNYSNGIVANPHSAAVIENVILYNNGKRNLAFGVRDDSISTHYELQNVLSSKKFLGEGFGDSVKDEISIPEVAAMLAKKEFSYLNSTDEVMIQGDADPEKVKNASVYLWCRDEYIEGDDVSLEYGSRNGAQVCDDIYWKGGMDDPAQLLFKNVDYTQIKRNADGTINTGELLKVSDEISSAHTAIDTENLVVRGTASKSLEEIRASLKDPTGVKKGEEVESDPFNGKFITTVQQQKIEQLKLANVERKNAAGTKEKPVIIDVPQSPDDTTVISEIYIKKKVRGRTVKVVTPGDAVELTVNSAAKYTLGDFGELVSADGSIKVNKKGVVSVKAGKTDGSTAVIKYKSAQNPEMENQVTLKIKNIKAVKGLKVTGLDAEVKVNIATYTGKESGIISAKWSIKGTELSVGEWSEVKKGKNVIAKARIAEDYSAVEIMGIGDDIKGNIKVVGEVNGKKINTTVKLVKKEK